MNFTRWDILLKKKKSSKYFCYFSLLCNNNINHLPLKNTQKTPYKSCSIAWYTDQINHFGGSKKSFSFLFFLQVTCTHPWKLKSYSETLFLLFLFQWGFSFGKLGIGNRKPECKISVLWRRISEVRKKKKNVTMEMLLTKRF